MVEPILIAAILEELADHDLYRKVRARMSDNLPAIEFDIDDL